MKIIKQVETYLEHYPQEKERISSLVEHINNGLDLFDRKILPGHVTGSAIVIEDDKILMILHPFLKKWLQPGGHVEQGETPLDAAKRELTEETGLTANIHPWHENHLMPIDIDIHCIPANEKKGEAAHLHYDFRYLLCADKNSCAKDQQEHQSSWIEFKKVEEPNLIALINKLIKQKL